MLRVRELTIAYDGFPAVVDVCLEVHAAEIVALTGPNGAGKTTLAKGIVGLVPISRGLVETEQNGQVELLSGKSGWAIARMGIVYVPESKANFEKLDVEENLKIAFSTDSLDRTRQAHLLHGVYDLFPFLKERSRQKAGSLSGGEKKLLSVARALLLFEIAAIMRPGRFRMVILDEPTHGLSPKSLDVVRHVVNQLKAAGCSVLLLDQVASFALDLSDRAYEMLNGSIISSGVSRQVTGTFGSTSATEAS